MKSVQCMGKTRSVCMGNPVGHRLDRSGHYGTGRSHCSSYRKDRPVITNNIKPLGSSWDRSGEMVMNKVGGAGSAVLHLPCIYIIATRFITRWFRAHWDCMLWGKVHLSPPISNAEHPPSLACTNGARGKSRSGKREPGRLFICTGRSCTAL